MRQSKRALGVLLIALTATGTLAGPAEINGLTQQLASIEAEIRSSAAQMRGALKDYTGAAGDEGQQLRTLKRERERLRRALQQATKAQADRDTTSKSMPTTKPALNLGPAATADERKGDKKPTVDVAPTGAMVPAPAL
ncbi:hypothetical protein [Candidatus Thiodictyon syntrophicum]|jgi:hypothetical protein|uniref:YbgF trimerisation domain-containing protein n=1 Tax=Candidatus Thiodictyon syntrophicum TaxID=1166950 RepID=A0A2K8UF11_9GAMM|nr:hypothetical protein [Candidatus Thiodictyon syntrophicum]AUB84125.1 hypothetical protein THSYN_26435 [Candidatus Thiodictyon syntrophicum]